MSLYRWLLAGCLTLSACTSAPRSPAPTALQAQSVKPATTLTAQVIRPDAIPQPVFGPLHQAAQAYADLTSKRRDIDYFRLHPQALGLRFETQGEQAWLFSLLGTALTRNDLNIELRILAAGGQTGMNLNYSGPVTQSRQLSSDTHRPATGLRRSGFSFELITGLPGNGVVEAYESFMTGLARHLQQRYQARPMTFDDGPLVYALHYGEQLQGFLFLNQRNTLSLGDRKYADVQSVVFFTPTRELKAAYTLVGFNPKTTDSQQGPAYQWESPGRFGHLVTFGEY